MIWRKNLQIPCNASFVRSKYILKRVVVSPIIPKQSHHKKSFKKKTTRKDIVQQANRHSDRSVSEPASFTSINERAIAWYDDTEEEFVNKQSTTEA